jgi:lauroyl/myristoyl acyltransferase
LLGRLYFFFNRKEKIKIKKAVKDVFSDQKNPSEIKAITKDVFEGIFAHYYEKFFNAFSTTELLKAFVRIYMEGEGFDAIEEGLAKGNGVILITGHFGGVELIPAFLGARTYPVTIVAKFKSERLRQISLQQADNFSVKIIDAEHTPNIMKEVSRHLKENRVVITQCDEIDEWRPSRSDHISFLKKPVFLDRSLNIITKRCKATVVFGVMHRDLRNGYKFVATSWEKMSNQYQRSVDMPLGSVVLKFMEQYIYNHPQEWYQWKKYSALDEFSPADIEAEVRVPIPLPEHSLGAAY